MLSGILKRVFLIYSIVTVGLYQSQTETDEYQQLYT